ncbi:hypothetical protein [Wenjunlia tyrosinilytica]|nr:hypothetical protein [Wenjunlia tyrosinilytica]
MERSANLRTVALASVVFLAAALPLAAASAGPAFDAIGQHRSGGAVEASPRAVPAEPGEASRIASAEHPDPVESAAHSLSLFDLPPLSATDEAGEAGETDEPGETGEAGEAGRTDEANDGRTAGASCGPEVTSPEGLKTQTCVLTEAGRTWARSYYRNATGDPLRMVLTLMREDGRTVQVHCSVAAARSSGTCETPRRRSLPAPSQASPGVSSGSEAGAPESAGAAASASGATGLDSAVAEVATEDGSRMLMRSGSNAPGQ